jgi:ABC-type multidrug transport system ATPase subunit
VGGISFDIEQGEMVGFLRPNGRGKMTTRKCRAGLRVTPPIIRHRHPTYREKPP